MSSVAASAESAPIEASECDPLLGQPHDERQDGDTNETEEVVKEPSNAELALIMGSLWTGVVFTALDSTIVATLLLPMSNTFSSLRTLSWLGSAYLIASAAAQPLAGRLTEIFGRREGAVVCNLLFATGTLICGLATTEWVLILGRVIAGMGGGALNTVSTVVGSDLVPLRKRGIVQGLNNIAMGAFGAVGGLFGGWIDSLLGWKWAFLVQVPFILLGAVLCFIAVKVPTKKSEIAKVRRVDWLGSITLVGTLVLLMLGLNSGGNLVPWDHPLVLTALPLSGVLLLIFVYVEDRASEPIVPIRLLFNRTIAAANSTYLFAFMASFGMMFYVPIYLQVLGNSPTQAGMRFIPQSMGTAIGAMSAGIVIRATGNYRYLNVGIHCILIATSIALVFLDLDSPPWLPFLYLGCFGLGFGGMLVATLIALISSADQSQQALLTAASFAFRSTGSTIGVTACSAIFQNALRSALWEKLGGLEDADEIVGRLLKTFDEIENVAPGVVAPVVQSYMRALHGVFLSISVFSLMAGISALCMRQNTLYMNLSRK